MKGLLESEQIKALVREESVRGYLVRKTLEEAENLSAEEVPCLEKALQLLLERFQSMEGQGS